MSTRRVIAAQMDATASTLRTLTGDWCKWCGHCHNDHSQILAGAPCLDCECFGWAPPGPEHQEPIWTAPEAPRSPRWQWGGLRALIFGEQAPGPPRATYDDVLQLHARIHNRALPSTAELQRYRARPHTVEARPWRRSAEQWRDGEASP